MSDSKHRTNIYLFADDVAWLNHHFGWGWSEKVREIVHKFVQDHRQPVAVLDEPSVREYIRDKIERENPGKDFP